LLILAVLIIVSLFAGGVVPARASNFQTHAPILIDGNGGFTAANGITGGSGTSMDPYVIAGWDISSAPQFGIRVHGTNASFVIRNVYVHDGAPSSFVGDSEVFGGISLNGVRNGIVENVAVSKTKNAITVYESDAVIITNNLVVSNHDGIGVFHSGRSGPVQIVGNSISSNGLGIWSSFAGLVVISGNSIDHNGDGIVLYNADTLITGNALSNNSLGLSEVNGANPFHNNFINNKVQVQADCGHIGACHHIFDGGYPNGGNYWSDFATVDNCSGPSQDICSGPDGISDKPLDMGSSIDRYPLTKPFAPLVSGEVKFEPHSITSQSSDDFLTAFVRLTKGSESSNIIPSSIRLNGTIAAVDNSAVGQQQQQQDGQQHERGAGVLVVKFNMTQVETLLSKPGTYTLIVSGNLLTNTNFRPFEATATVRLSI
jgi:parallel beta-helix repeat protein